MVLGLSIKDLDDLAIEILITLSLLLEISQSDLLVSLLEIPSNLGYLVYIKKLRFVSQQVLLAKESVNSAEVQALLSHLLIVDDELLYFSTLKIIKGIITLNHIACKL